MSMDFSNRSAYIGAHVRPSVKKALGEEASLRDTSVSAYVSDLVEGHLKALGYDLTEPGPEDPRLPFEE